MKTRYSLPLLFLVPCIMVSVIAMVLSGATAAGFLWLYVHGDNPWPDSAGTIAMAVAFIAAAVVLAALLSTCYLIGKRQESTGGLTGRQIAIAVAMTVLLPALVVLHQWRIGNIGKPVPAASSFKPDPLHGSV